MRLEFTTSRSVDPYHNLALEAELFDTCPKDTVRFYLWQNAHTVVIGKNQYAPSEVYLEALKADGGHLARRTSGGGAVYHDLGNLNFTFIARGDLFNIPRQMGLIAVALRSLGVNAVVNGRNDIEIDGAKVSGNAFLHQGDRHLHHGTLLIDVDRSKLSRYLNVHPKKLQRKQVSSVSARIVNLRELIDIDLDTLKTVLFKTVENAFGTVGTTTQTDPSALALRTRSFRDPLWLLGNPEPETLWLDTALPCGTFRWSFKTENGLIVANHLYTDLMDADFAPWLQERLIGTHADPDAIRETLIRLNADHPSEPLQALILELNPSQEIKP